MQPPPLHHTHICPSQCAQGQLYFTTTTITTTTTTTILNKIEEDRRLQRIIDEYRSEQSLSAYEVTKLCFSQHSDLIVLLQYKVTDTQINALLTLRLLTSCIYGPPILDVSRSHTTTQHSR